MSIKKPNKNKPCLTTFGNVRFEPKNDDYYASPPEIIDHLLKYETFDNNIWECACGDGALSKRLEHYGYNVKSTDLVYRGYGSKEPVDFLKQLEPFNGDIITNPPFNLINEFILKGYNLTKNKLAIFGKVQILETIRRYNEIHTLIPFSRMYVYVKRVSCYKNGIKANYESTVCYCWFIWDKSYDGEPIVRWINNVDK